MSAIRAGYLRLCVRNAPDPPPSRLPHRPATALVVLATALSGCEGITGIQPVTQVRVVDASPDAPALDIYQNSPSQPAQAALYNIGFGTVSSYIPLTPGAYTHAAYTAGTQQQLASVRGTFSPGSQYTVLAGNIAADLQMTVLKDQSFPAPAGEIALRILGQHTRSGAVDLYLLPSGSTFARPLPSPPASPSAVTPDTSSPPRHLLHRGLPQRGRPPDSRPVFTGSQAEYLSGSVRTIVLIDQFRRSRPPPHPACNLSPPTTSSPPANLARFPHRPCSANLSLVYASPDRQRLQQARENPMNRREFVAATAALAATSALPGAHPAAPKPPAPDALTAPLHRNHPHSRIPLRSRRRLRGLPGHEVRRAHPLGHLLHLASRRGVVALPAHVLHRPPAVHVALQNLEPRRLRCQSMDGHLPAGRHEDVCLHLQASRRLLHVRHQNPRPQPRQLDRARRPAHRVLRPRLLHHGDALPPRRGQGVCRRRPQARHQDRPLLLPPRLVRRRLPPLRRASVPDPIGRATG